VEELGVLKLNFNVAQIEKEYKRYLNMVNVIDNRLLGTTKVATLYMKVSMVRIYNIFKVWRLMKNIMYRSF
jgi:hypothetical protein